MPEDIMRYYVTEDADFIISNSFFVLEGSLETGYKVKEKEIFDLLGLQEGKDYFYTTHVHDLVWAAQMLGCPYQLTYMGTYFLYYKGKYISAYCEQLSVDGDLILVVQSYRGVAWVESDCIELGFAVACNLPSSW